MNEKQKEEYLFKIVEETLNWLGIQICEKENDSVTGIGQVTQEEIADLVMLKLVNIK